ncbi:HD-GYP domain-containing protein [Pseudomonas sp. FEN]|uniref:HD-GYP domain-containing protein n=1 Tax=Pseudomonas sp. FEN TaxID=2767468 RepID=UPI001CD53FAB|nr:HD domain-containing phosphohydrolase [Pseudomonas sp. FEN]
MLTCKDLSDCCEGMQKSERCGTCPESPYWKGGLRLDRGRDLHDAPDTGADEGGIDTPEALNVQCRQDQQAIASDSVVAATTMTEELVTAKKLYVQSKLAVIEMFTHARMGRVVALEQADELVDNISLSIARHPHAFISLARLKSADEYTYMHSVAVGALMIALAKQLDFSEELVHQAGLAGLLHDIGKMAVPGAILNKPGKLTDSEFDRVRQHPQLGAHILRSSVQVCELVMDVCLHHHEKVDGSGYPDQLAGEQISLFSRMAAVCDVYDAVTSDRPYKEAWSPALAIQKMSEWKEHFDSSVFQAFVKSVGIYPIGSIVRLSSGNVGVVVEQDPHSLLTPKVKVFFSVPLNAYITPSVIDISTCAQSEKIVERLIAKQYGFKNIEALWVGAPIES